MQTEKEDKLILSRAEDAIAISEKSYSVRCMGFLNPHQRELIKKNVVSCDTIMSFEGGYEGAERTLLVCRPEYVDFELSEYIKVIRCTGRDLNGLTHRDYLGSIMGLGIVRENIGDILVCDDKAFVFVKSDIADYIMNNLSKIGRHGVDMKLCRCEEADIPEPEYKEIKGTVSSLRLDAVLSLAAGISRTRAAELIEQELISVNWEKTTSVSHKMEEGDLISARGIGRIRLSQIGGVTRKGRLGIVLLKYQ